MRSGSEGQASLANPDLDGATREFDKWSKISYSRDFLLFFGELSDCTKLSRDFDPSVLREMDEVSTGLSKSSHNSDSGRCGNLSRGLLQDPAHDGLLGSGKIATGSDCNVHKKSVKPYRPPHFYKAIPYSGRGGNDLYNEETFGSSQLLSEEKAKDETRRRASFEWIRKDQRKAIQEKHDKISDEHKSEECALSPGSDGGSAKGLLSTPTPASGQLKPPGCTSRSLEKDSETKSMTSPPIIEVASGDGNLAALMTCDSKGKQPEKWVGSDDQLRETTDGTSEKLYHCSKPTVTQDVRTCKDPEQATLSEVNEKHPTQCNNVQGWSASGAEDGRYNSANDHSASHDLLTWRRAGVGRKDLKLSSELNKGSSDELHLLKSGSHNISGNGNAAKFENNLTQLLLGTGFTKEVQSNELPVTQKDSVGRVEMDSALEPWMHPSLVANDSIFLSVVDECRPIGDKHEALMSTRSDKQIGLNKIKGHQSVSPDIQPEKESKFQTEQQPALVPSSCLDKKDDFMDDIHLPDEESLMTFDYSIGPQDSMSVPSENSTGPVLFASSQQIDRAKKLAGLNFSPSDERSGHFGLGNPTLRPNYHDTTGMNSPYAQQSYPQYSHPQLKPQRAHFHVSHNQYLRNVLPSPFEQPLTRSTRHEFPASHPQLEQMPIPGGFSHPQLPTGLQSGLPSDHHINQFPYYAQKPNPYRAFPTHYQQPGYGGHGMSDPDPGVGRYNNQVAFNQLYKNELAGKQMETLTFPSHSRGLPASRLTWDFDFW